MKEYNVTLTIRNNYLFQYMQTKDINTASELARKSGISPSAANMLLTLKIAPMGARGWREAVLKLADFFNCQPENLFPPQHIHEPMQKNEASFEMSGQDVMEVTASLRQSAISPEVSLMLGQSQDYFNKKLEEILTPRQHKILKMRFGLEDGKIYTLKEVGEHFEIAGTYVGLLEKKAMNKIANAAKRDENFKDAANIIMKRDI